MSSIELLTQIADQAEIVQRLRRIARRAHDTESLRDCMAAEVMLDRLLARRRGTDYVPMFGEE